MRYWMIAILAIVIIVIWTIAALTTLSSIKKADDDLFVVSSLIWMFITVIAAVFFAGIIFG